MELIQRLENIEQFIEQNKHLDEKLFTIFEGEKVSSGLSASRELRAEFERLDDQNRLLRVGIIGRVKAGKSSLLNALLFNGNDILPKAATPMTAALTIMEYSEQIRAEVDFYTEQDIDDIAQKSQDFERRLNNLKQQKLTDLKQIPKNQNTPLSELQDKATRQAEREMKGDHYYASYDQYQRIKCSGISSVKTLEQFKHLQANSIEDLMNNQLNQFVGADGKYMPFTKSIKLYIPEEGLKGLEIIDTPGINDPVTSRGKRTEQLLKSCDVVLLVSPSGQFLSNEDIELMTRITTREGIQEVYIIASQVDNQLFGSAREGLSQPSEVLAKISTDLTAHAHSTLSQQANKFAVFDLFQKSKVLCTSSVAFSQLQRFEQQHSWDHNLQHVWHNLTSSFPDTFNYPELAKSALQQLAGIEAIKQIIAEVRNKKDKIMAGRKAELEKGQLNAIQDHLKSLVEYVDGRINKIQNGDLEELREKSKMLNQQKESIRMSLLEVSDELLDYIKLDLSQYLKSLLKQEIRKLITEDAQSTESEKITVMKEVWVEGSMISKGLAWLTGHRIGESGHYEKRPDEKTVYYKSTHAGQIRSRIENMLNDLEDILEPERYKKTQEWKKSLNPKISRALRSVVEDSALDYQLIQSAIRDVAYKIPDDVFYIDRTLPSAINKTGTLRDSEGDRFLDAVGQYISNLENSVRDQINDYIQKFYQAVEKVDISTRFIEELEKEIRQSISDIENSKERLDELNTMKNSLNNL